MDNSKIERVIDRIKERMTNAPGAENIRILVSTHLTKVLMLFGRLNNDYNPRYLPVTFNSISLLINELKMMESKYGLFDEILRENIERREKYSNVFMIPEVLKNNPNTNGLEMAMKELAAPLVKCYCAEERLFLTTLSDPVSVKTRIILFSRATRNCELLRTSCPPEDLALLGELRAWCQVQLGARAQ